MIEPMAMPENKNTFRKSLDGLIGVRSREAQRQISYRFQYQLLGAVTKKP
jgi:hypothetical protein